MLMLSKLLKTMLVISGLIISTNAIADPVLSGNLIQSINTDKSRYGTLDPVIFTLTLKNNTSSTFTGNITGSVYGRGIKIGYDNNLSVTSLAAGASTTVQMIIQSSGLNNWQGYEVNFVASNSSGTQVDQESGSFDVSPDWWTYPRQCWITGTWTDWGGVKPIVTMTPEESIKSLNSYHCNNLQFYNNIYRWHTGYTPLDSYVNGDGFTQSKQLILENIAVAKKYKMGTLNYFPIYSANKGIAPTFQNDGMGVKLDWAVFTSNCGSTNSCTVADGWNFDSNIIIMNTQNQNWQDYWAQQAKLMVQEYGYDGIFGDTYGTISLALWDINGNRMINDKMYSSFINRVTSDTGIPMTINPAGSYNEEDLVSANREVYHFTERWNNSSDIGNFGDFLTKARQVWGWANRKPNNVGLDWDMGMNKTLGASTNCWINGGSNWCWFNTPGVMYQEAADLATGAHHAWMVDGEQSTGNGARFISNDDYPMGNMIAAPSDMVQKEYDYQTFGVANEKMLRLNISASTVSDPSITSGATGSTTAAAGSVWMFQNHRSGFDILHLLNYQQMSTTSFSDVNDNAANAAAPTTTGNIAIKMYYTSGGTLGNLYFASPDVNHGVPQNISYTTGSDTSGSYITFTLPSLQYWDMVWLENGVDSSDYTSY